MPPFATAESSVATLDPLVVNPGRLSILLTLATQPNGVEFVDLRKRTRLTDGNLATHAKRLAEAGLIGIEKEFRAGKPVTTYLLTANGEASLRSHVDGLVSAVTGKAVEQNEEPAAPIDIVDSAEETWVD